MDDASGFYTARRHTLAESTSGALRRPIIAFGLAEPLGVKGADLAFRKLHN